MNKFVMLLDDGEIGEFHVYIMPTQPVRCAVIQQLINTTEGTEPEENSCIDIQRKSMRALAEEAAELEVKFIDHKNILQTMSDEQFMQFTVDVLRHITGAFVTTQAYEG